ncbi:MAG TPA: threonine ammonia-lyase, biosynthetic, partial [Pseudomonadales bacterium]|nr:threonine ammonia-lyase, biosynthetic [Pseudomonadales bacterium]
MHFLNGLGQRWNISLFHYRNHGAADGRVLAGLQVPTAEYAQLEKYLNALNYPWQEETGNAAYQLFLG